MPSETVELLALIYQHVVVGVSLGIDLSDRFPSSFLGLNNRACPYSSL